MKKNGFVSTSLIYTFFILFLLLMIFLLNSYSSKRFLLDKYKYDIKNSFSDETLADINLYFMVYNNRTKDYELKSNLPDGIYTFDTEKSYCKNGAAISYDGSNVVVEAQRKESCYAYFNPTQETMGNVPENADILINMYKESIYGTIEKTTNGTTKKYERVKVIPGGNYEYNSDISACENGSSLEYENGEIIVDAGAKDVCDVYFDALYGDVELILMQQVDDGETGVKGYTTGVKYKSVSIIPSSGYRYVGYICNSSNVTLKLSNGTFEVVNNSSNENITCYAYFEKYTGGTYINYYLKTSSDQYERVYSVPDIGYVYKKSECSTGLTASVDENNIVIISGTSTEENAKCDVYFDLTSADIEIKVYVWNRETNKFELGSVPVAGYEIYNAGCTNGASITYEDGSLDISSEGPTVCTVYFR